MLILKMLESSKDFWEHQSTALSCQRGERERDSVTSSLGCGNYSNIYFAEEVGV